MAFPTILYLSILRTAGVVITASSTDTGYAATDLGNMRAYKGWQSATLVTGITIDIDLGSDIGSADTIGVINQNITSQGGTIEVRADTSAGPNPPTTVRQAAYTPLYGDVDLQTFSAATNLRRWRLVLAKGGNFATKPFIGEVFLGMRTTLPEYLSPDTDPFLKGTEAAAALSEGGQYLGAILRGRVHPFDLATGPAGITRTFFTSDLDALIDNHVDLLRPFIFQLDSADADFKKPVYVKRKQETQVSRKAVGGMYNRMTLSIPCEEAYSEAP